jgi:hypothetical protein
MIDEPLLRNLVRQNQFAGTLGNIYKALYQSRDFMVVDRLHDMVDFVPPLISVEIDEHVWRGRYASTGSLGFEDVITLNAMQLKLSEEMLRTLAHELGHWFIRRSGQYPEGDWRGHGDAWRTLMRDRFGLAFDEHGKCLRDFGEWYELEVLLQPQKDVLDIHLLP